jgi:hypothetical protein
VPELGSPLALDRYAYVYNNPLRYTDPGGCQPEYPPFEEFPLVNSGDDPVPVIEVGGRIYYAHCSSTGCTQATVFRPSPSQAGRLMGILPVCPKSDPPWATVLKRLAFVIVSMVVPPLRVLTFASFGADIIEEAYETETLDAVREQVYQAQEAQGETSETLTVAIISGLSGQNPDYRHYADLEYSAVLVISGDGSVVQGVVMTPEMASNVEWAAIQAMFVSHQWWSNDLPHSSVGNAERTAR